MRPSDKTMISAIAGTTTGAVAGLLRMYSPQLSIQSVVLIYGIGGPSKILPAMVMWGFLGAGGQMLVNHSEASNIKPKA